MIRARINNRLLLLCLLLCMGVQAQFKNKAVLPPVSKTGFYSIAVTPELSSYIKTDFSDLRIKDNEGKVVPYVVTGGINREYDTGYTKLNIKQNELNDSGNSVVIIENAEKISISSISLLIKSTLVSKMVTVNGSDDNVHWYSIVDNDLFKEQEYNLEKFKSIETINFPLSSYKYFRFIIHNNKNAPLNIISAGIYHQVRQVGNITYRKNPGNTIKQVDSSDGNSYVFINDSLAFHKNYVEIVSGNQKFFTRSAAIINGNRIIASNTITSINPTFRDIQVFKAKNWVIKIFNGDNPPLEVNKVITKQEDKRITAWLDSGKTYHLEMNDSAATAPIYDLQDFKDSIPPNVSEIKVGAVQPIAAGVAATVSSSSSFFKQQWLWVALGIVLIVLVIFTARLTRDMSKKQ